MENDKDQGGAAVRGEAVADARSNETLQALKDVTDVLDAFGDMPDGWISPKAWNSQAAQEKIDAAREVLARAADAPSEPSEPPRLDAEESREYLVTFMEQHFTDTTFHRYIRGQIGGSGPLAGDFAWQMARALRRIEAGVVKSRAADALDSQPTDLRNGLGVAGMRSTQPTVAAQQGSIADDDQFFLLIDQWRHSDLCDRNDAYANLVNHIDSRASFAPVAPIAPTLIADDRLVSMHDGEVMQHPAYGEGIFFTHDCLREVPAPQQEGSEADNG